MGGPYPLLEPLVAVSRPMGLLDPWLRLLAHGPKDYLVDYGIDESSIPGAPGAPMAPLT